MSLQEAIDAALAKQPQPRAKLPRIKRPKLTKQEWLHSLNPLMERGKLNWSWHLDPEQRLSIEFADIMRDLTLKGVYRGLWGHLPNEGKRHQIVGAIMKAMGMISGQPDYFFMWEKGHGVIELKFGNGKLTETQWHYQLWCEAENINHAVCWTAQEAVSKLAEWGAI